LDFVDLGSFGRIMHRRQAGGVGMHTQSPILSFDSLLRIARF
jgi:hypothetical protein